MHTRALSREIFAAFLFIHTPNNPKYERFRMKKAALSQAAFFI